MVNACINTWIGFSILAIGRRGRNQEIEKGADSKAQPMPWFDRPFVPKR